ncbi:MAG TPA: aminobutyraldehyde dehydrogenase [Solirubrobacteraceae bacterium]|nr:aminobutyraldehyde dehydrogenase [Solirubrobacteraceae bacterium]
MSVPNLIGGEAVEALAGATREVLNPATGRPIASVPEGTRADVERAVAAAAAAAAVWRDTTPGRRAQALLHLADLLDEHSEELAQLESANVGKPITLARQENPISADNLRFFAAAARTLEGRAAGEYVSGHTSMVRREPIGVVGQIAPWNYPLQMAIWKLGPALAAGNTVVLKPSELTPLTLLRFAELVAEREILPPGVLNVITGDGEHVGAAIVDHPEVRLVSITGDVRTGKIVASAATANLKKVHLELGGKAPMIVLDDADIEAVVQGIRLGGFLNSGQDCTACSRVIASERIHDQLIAALRPAIQSLEVGDPAAGERIEMGPVISAEHRDRVHGFLERAAAGGATVLISGSAPEGSGSFVAPTVVGGVTQEMEIVQRELFGPVVTVQRFAEDSQALDWANGVDYGLAASVWTRDLARALAMSRRLHFGTVWVNDHLPFMSEMPHGGFKQSGYGKDMSVYAVQEYTQIKHVMVSLQ